MAGPKRRLQRPIPSHRRRVVPGLRYPRLSATDDARADVYWELPTVELILELRNVQGFGPGGKGYQLLVPTRY